MWVFFRLIGKCMAKANCWKYKIRRNEPGLNPPVLWLSTYLFRLQIRANGFLSY